MAEQTSIPAFKIDTDGNLFLQGSIACNGNSTFLDYDALIDLPQQLPVETTTKDEEGKTITTQKIMSKLPIEAPALTSTGKIAASSIAASSSLTLNGSEVATKASVDNLRNDVFPESPTLANFLLRRVYISETAPTSDLTTGDIWIKVEPTGSDSVG